MVLECSNFHLLLFSTIVVIEYMNQTLKSTHSMLCIYILMPRSFFPFSFFFICLELVLIGVLHQHGVVRLILLGSKVDIVLDIENSALGLILDRLEVKE